MGPNLGPRVPISVLGFLASGTDGPLHCGLRRTRTLNRNQSSRAILPRTGTTRPEGQRCRPHAIEPKRRRDWAEGALWGPVHPSYIWRQMARCPHCFLLVPVIILDSPGPSLLMLQGLSSKFLDHVSSGCVHAAVFALAASETHAVHVIQTPRQVAILGATGFDSRHPGPAPQLRILFGAPLSLGA